MDMISVFTNLTLEHIMMLDSWGKFPAGLLELNGYQFGAPWECRHQPHQDAHYCTILNLRENIGLQIDFNFSSEYIPKAFRSNITSADVIFPSAGYGLCVPRSCTEENLLPTLNAYSEHLPFRVRFDPVKNQFSDYVHNKPVACIVENPPLDNNAVVVVTCFAFIAALGVSASLIDCAYKHMNSNDDEDHDDHDQGVSSEQVEPLLRRERRKKEKKQPPAWVNTFVEVFSVTKHLKAILSLKPIQESPDATIDLRMLNGVRVLSLLWVILGHTYIWILQVPLANPKDLIPSFERVDFLLVLNAFFSVDSFFLMSGFLAAYFLFQILLAGKRIGAPSVLIMYLHRYLRLTPLYLAVLVFYAYVAGYLGTGPVWSTLDFNHDQCKTGMWKNLLYINAYDDVNYTCGSWMWYLSNDFQFFLVAPWVVLLLFHMPEVGHVVFFALMAASTATCIIFTIQYDLKAFWVIGFLRLFEGYGFENSFLAITKYIYFKPWARIQPYLVGIYLAYFQILWGKQFFKTKWPVRIGYLFTFITLGLCVFGLHPEQIGRPLSVAENVLYISLSRVAWGLALGFLVLACANGRGGFINSLLGSPFWGPFARVGYAAYLVHPMLLETTYYQMQSAFIFSTWTMATMFVAHAGLSYGVAVLATAFIESPIRTLDKMLFRMKKKEPKKELIAEPQLLKQDKDADDEPIAEA
eukprot:TRINITY_DN19710_c0_g1_i1.p1 TRINITY_DN19710_c0_g1~~TRINITY_DN19710_c0_g1_i1.p1  ORF type:complete len:748 (+),score=190.41 TRINITY_DN19710_c0_g1_i1:164-2245(+)